MKWATVEGNLIWMLWKDIECPWETEDTKGIANLTEDVHNASALKPADITNGTRQIVMGGVTSLEGWGAIVQQGDENRDC